MTPDYEIRVIRLDQVADLCFRYHGYGGVGNVFSYCFGVIEDDRVVAAFTWQPPPPQASKSVCPEAPQAVLSLSRMVAVPRSERRLNHISRPLRHQMKHLIDRSRWPVLITFSDEGQGHTGHVYKCSGWQPTARSEKRAFFVDDQGRRASSYANGKHGGRLLARGGTTTIQRWEHWVCPRGEAANHLVESGWIREAIPGKVWKSGNQAHRYVKVEA